MDVSRLYHPITATPFRNDHTYREAAPAHALLRPWIRCLWGGLPGAAPTSPHPVIPDTCTDIIFRISTHSGCITADYCALNDKPFFSGSTAASGVELFAVRFFPWAAHLFMQDSLSGSLNLSFDARQHFPALVRPLLRMLAETEDFDLRCMRAESILLAHLDQAVLRAPLMNAMADMLQARGRLRVSELAAHNQVSARQLERLFHEYTGVSPKKLSELIRYQYLWREAASSSAFDVQDAVFRYGYADQSHLLRQFKQYHGMTLSQAIAFARANVGFVQYSHLEKR